MNNKGISGFSAVFLILLLIVLSYVGYSIGMVWFRGESLEEKIKNTLRLKPMASDSYLISQFIREAKELNIELIESDIFIDRTIPDSVLAIVEYRDSSVMPVYTYRKLKHIEVSVPVRAE